MYFYKASNTDSYTNLQCAATEYTSGLKAEVNPLAHYKATWYSYQPKMALPQLPRIADNTWEAFTAPTHQLVNKVSGVFTKPRKPVA